MRSSPLSNDRSPDVPVDAGAKSGGAHAQLRVVDDGVTRAPACAGEEDALHAPPHDDREQIARLFEMTNDVLAMLSPEGCFTLVNPAWETQLGWPREQLLGKPLTDFIHPDDVERTAMCLLGASSRETPLENFSTRFRHRDGGWRTLSWSGRCDGELWFLAAHDVTDRESLELRAMQALRDPLTTLPNRLLLMDRTSQAIARLQRSDGIVALIFVDLDRFKAVNDRYGHDVGDRLLISVSERLSEMMRDSDTVARLGGDEFVILAEELESEAEALALAERVLAALSEPVPVGPAEVSMPASVGVSISKDHTADPEGMLREADLAMYRAKDAGGRRLELFGETLRAEASAQLELEERLVRAVPRKELRLSFQPIMPLAGGRAVGCEALLRWYPGDEQGATIEELLPSDFLPRAGESELIMQIGEWVLETACAQAETWRRAGVPVPVSVNISERELFGRDLAARVSTTLATLRLPGPSLCIEVSEETVMHDLERAKEALESVRRLGVATALDNFGTGESSLSLPRSLPLDMLKLDRTLIEAFEGDRKTRAIVAATIALAKEAGLRAVAVGIESRRQLAVARELGVTIGQGFFLHRPDTADRVRLAGAVGDVLSAPWRPRVRLGDSNRRL
jgi:diguanylate cyclase (GGDEF)-like protein/PAS domain S-box-containing protein